MCQSSRQAGDVLRSDDVRGHMWRPLGPCPSPCYRIKWRGPAACIAPPAAWRTHPQTWRQTHRRPTPAACAPPVVACGRRPAAWCKLRPYLGPLRMESALRPRSVRSRAADAGPTNPLCAGPGNWAQATGRARRPAPPCRGSPQEGPGAALPRDALCLGFLSRDAPVVR